LNDTARLQIDLGREVVDKLVARHGGRYVARTTNPWEVLEGAAPDVTNITMIEFPIDRACARASYNDPGYAAAIWTLHVLGRSRGHRLCIILQQKMTLDVAESATCCHSRN